MPACQANLSRLLRPTRFSRPAVVSSQLDRPPCDSASKKAGIVSANTLYTSWIGVSAMAAWTRCSNATARVTM